MTLPDRGDHKTASEAEAERLHEEAERIAVPEFDWIGQPIAAFVEAVAAVVPHHHAHTPSTQGENAG